MLTNRSRVAAPLVCIAVLLFAGGLPGAASPSAAKRPRLSLAERIAAQARIERVWFNHRESAGTVEDEAARAPDLAFAATLPPTALSDKVLKSLSRSRLLRERYGITLTEEALRGEVARMARETRDPKMLRELFAALGNDPVLIAETLGREALTERLLRGRFDNDAAIQADRLALVSALHERAAGAGSFARVAEDTGAETYRVTLRATEDDAPSPGEPGVFTVPRVEFAQRAEKLPASGVLSPIEETEAGYGFTRTLRLDGREAQLETLLVRKLDFTHWFDAQRAAYTTAELESEAAAFDAGGALLPEVSAATAGRCNIWDNQFRIAQAPYRRSGHVAVWTGTEMIIWGGSAIVGGTATLFDTGDGARYNPTTDTWTAMSDTDAPTGRLDATVVWTGTEMIVWGGSANVGGGQLDTGARYNPTADTWTPTPTTGAVPTARVYHSAVWTGTEMIVWGGATDTGFTNTGARYNPSTNLWAATGTGVNTPSARDTFSSAVLAGTQMIVWGGYSPALIAINTGGRYDLLTDSWQATSVGANVPSPRLFHTAVWMGTSMVVFGGASSTSGGATNTGGRYDPTANTWLSTSTGANVPAVRFGHTAIRAGAEMVVWGGHNTSTFDFLNTGGRYDPVANTWIATPVSASTPVGRSDFTAVWTNTEMIVWGGKAQNSLEASGGRFNPTTGTWTATATAGPAVPSGRQGAGSVFAGVELFVWGGFTYNGSVYTYLNSGARFRPVLNTWTTMGTGANVPDPRGLHTVAYVSTATPFLLVYGGTGAAALSANHGRYNPATDAWLNLTQGANFPGPRVRHVGLAAASRLVVWGGDSCFGNCGTFLNTGAYYNAAADSWGVIPTASAPTGRRNATAVYSGSEVVVWGGQLSSGLYTNTGAHYSVSGNSWVAATGTLLAPAVRQNAVAVIDRTTLPTTMYLFGGDNGTALTTGGRYDVAARTWKTMNTTGAPCSAKRAVWTGREMIIMCKAGVGARYYPGVFETWQTTSTAPEIPTIGDEFTWNFSSSYGETYLTGGGSGSPVYSYPNIGGIYVGTIGAGSPFLDIVRNGSNVDLTWTPIGPPVAWYNVKRCAVVSGPCIPTTVVGTPATTAYSESTAGGSFFYLIEGATSCGTAP